MKRLHVHVSVRDIPQSIGFYSALFASQPAVVKEDYAQGETSCCYAKSEKSWIDDPAGIAWETFLTTGESITYGDGTGENTARVAHEKQGACCVPEATTAKVASACC